MVARLGDREAFGERPETASGKVFSISVYVRNQLTDLQRVRLSNLFSKEIVESFDPTMRRQQLR